MHTVGVLDIKTGHPASPPAVTWTDVFSEALVDLGGLRHDLAAVTAAMPGPTGLQRFADRFPGRCHDVGIAEQHALTSAAGMAMGGLHPVVALYATFASRAFDQELLDVGLHRLPVTLVLDRAGVTGPDGASHHGLWDLALLGLVPGMRVAAPRDATTLVDELTEAVDVAGPTALRFPKARVEDPLPAIRRSGDVDVLRDEPADDVLLVSVGAMARAVTDAAEMLAGERIACTVVDPRWVLPVSDALVDLAADHRLVVTVEDGVRVGGVGSHLAAALRERGVEVPLRCLGLPTRFLPHGGRTELLAAHGLDAAGVAAAVREVAHAGRPRPLSLVPADERPVRASRGDR
jgi:1-deoxy-D-xylulose-5-phosphate synthase